MSELTFELQSIYLQSCQVLRGERKPEVGGGLLSTVNYMVSKAEYNVGTTLVRVATRLDISIFGPADDDEEQIEESNKIGSVYSEHVATFEAERPISDEDATQLRLDAAIDASHEVLFPYHRASIEELSGKLGVVPFRLPTRWQEVSRGFAAEAEAGEDGIVESN